MPVGLDPFLMLTIREPSGHFSFSQLVESNLLANAALYDLSSQCWLTTRWTLSPEEWLSSERSREIMILHSLWGVGVVGSRVWEEDWEREGHTVLWSSYSLKTQHVGFKMP